jgi:hypothetical protein
MALLDAKIQSGENIHHGGPRVFIKNTRIESAGSSRIVIKSFLPERLAR